MPPGVTTFDLLDHHRKRTRHAEARAHTLEQINDRLYRLLTLTTLIAVRGTELDPLTLLAVIEDLDGLAA